MGEQPKYKPGELEFYEKAADQVLEWVRQAARDEYLKRHPYQPRRGQPQGAQMERGFMVVNTGGSSHIYAANVPTPKPAPKAAPPCRCVHCRPRRPAALHTSGCGCPECVNVRERVRAQLMAEQSADVESRLLELRLARMVRPILAGRAGESVLDRKQ